MERATHRLKSGPHELELATPLLMGILNATPDSFSDGGAHPDLDSQLARGRRLQRDGAALLDVGGESGVTNQPPVAAGEEIKRVIPLVERLVDEEGALISVDTYKPAVARAAIEAGAVMVNDPSGLIEPEMAEICAESGTALVITHTRARPKQKLHRPRYDDVVDDVKRFLEERMSVARRAGVADEQMLLCPGPDLGKDPAQTIELLRRLGELHELGRPILLAVSRKDFVGALTAARPRERLAGTLAAVDHGVSHGADVLRVHDVAAVRDFLKVRAALAGEVDVPSDLLLAEDLRREPVAGTAGARS